MAVRVHRRFSFDSNSRNRLIQEYINSFKSFEDTLSKANEGVEFYKKVMNTTGIQHRAHVVFPFSKV